MAAPAAQAEAMQRTAIARLTKTEAARPALVDASVRSDRKTVADATYELMTTDLRPELARIQAPVQVVYAYDALYGIPASSVDATFRNAYTTTPNISFKRIDGSFHFVMLDQPQAFAAAVIDFLGR
ncbi:Alpha/beta hydrolase family protein [compost metagenome]